MPHISILRSWEKGTGTRVHPCLASVTRVGPAGNRFLEVGAEMAGDTVDYTPRRYPFSIGPRCPVATVAAALRSGHVFKSMIWRGLRNVSCG